MRRKIIHIDEAKCDGCGECVTACHEGAIQLVNGKAKLVSDVYCDGLGDCLGECPQGAITIEVREAEAYDEAAVHPRQEKVHAQASSHASGGCPGSAVRDFRRAAPVGDAATKEATPSRLGNWPVKIELAPVNASWFHEARLVIAADCSAYAFGDFHEELLKGRFLLTGCPKFGNADLYRRKLTDIFRENDIRAVEVVYMEVPCCLALVQQVREILGNIGKRIPLTTTKVSIRGKVLESIEDLP